MSHCLPCRIAYSSFEVLTQSWKCWSALCGPRLTCKVINLQNSANISSWYWADLWPCLSSLCATRYRTPQSAQVITCSATPTRSGNRDQATSCIKMHSKGIQNAFKWMRIFCSTLNHSRKMLWHRRNSILHALVCMHLLCKFSLLPTDVFHQCEPACSANCECVESYV